MARDGATICFIEVRSRGRSDYGHPLETIGPHKRQRIARAARAWLREHRQEGAEARFDCVAVTPDGVELVPGAFEDEGR